MGNTIETILQVLNNKALGGTITDNSDSIILADNNNYIQDFKGRQYGLPTVRYANGGHLFGDGGDGRTHLPRVGDSWRNTETDESGTVVGYAPDAPYMGDDGKLYPTTSPVVKYDSGETLFGVTPQYTLPEVEVSGHLRTPADNLDKVMLGTLAVGVAPMALPEIASGAATALANPYVDAALTSYFGAHGINDIANGRANAMTALEVLPMARLAKPLWNVGKNTLKHTSNITDSTSQTISLEDTVSPKSLRITADNAASMTPEQWTAVQDAAIARGDMAEAQRLRDLHFKVNAPDTKVVDIKGSPQLVIHKTPNDFTVFDNSRSIGNLNWAATPKAFEGEDGVFATGAGPNPKDMRLYVNMKNPHYPTIDEGMEPSFIENGEDGILGIVDKDRTNFFKSSSEAGEGFDMSLGVDNPYALKSADAVTYDNNGVRIPLGKRDNFRVNDIRYGWIPWLVGAGAGATGYGLYDNFNSTNSDIHSYGGPLVQQANIFKKGGTKNTQFLPEIIITPDREYNQYLNTLPDNQRLTPNEEYDSYLYWKLNGRPRNFQEGINRKMFHYNKDDKSWHANSVAWGDDGIGYFMKPKSHPTIHMETDRYNKGLIYEDNGTIRQETPEEKAEFDNFRNNYDLIDDPDRPNYFRYQPKNKKKYLLTN